MNGHIDKQTYRCMDGRINRHTDVWMDVRMDEWTYRWMYWGFHEKGTFSYLCALWIDRQYPLNECTLQVPLI